MASLPNSKTILSASPTDISRFLVWKDRHGKTIVHSNGCPDSHLQNAAKCKCPKRLAFKTIDSYIGKLRAIFKETGRCGEWNSLLGLGNPAASLEVQKYLKASTEEQLRARITPKQAVPLFLSKLLLLARFLNRKIAERSVSPSGLFVLTRDQAFFKTLFFSGDRGSDLGMVLCPVKAIETYVAVASELRVSVTNGYLFRPTNPQGHIVNKPFSSSSAEARLKLYLKEAKIDEGETLHSFRSGSAITLALSGSQLADIMSHVGWNNKETALYYMKLAEVLRLDSPSHLLSADSSATAALTENYMELNRLKNFISAFPHV